MLNLSYLLCKDTPMYGGGASPVIKAGKDMLKGDSCNTLELSLTSHTCTHIDCPFHFDESGKTLTDYPPEFWYSEKIECLFMAGDMEFLPGQLINGADVEKLIVKDVKPDIEVILLKTGFCEKRNSEIYWKEPPGMDHSFPDFLRSKFSRLKFFGMDIISVSSFADRKAGRLAHKAFLKHENPILPIEDMDLRMLPRTLSNILVAPLYLKDADGAPCTVFADIGL